MDQISHQDTLSQQIYDIIVIGLGAMGSASFYHACSQGKTVLAIEQFDLLHQNGSSHGETRAIRECYFEGSFYIPMVKESLKMWKELEVKSNQKLYVNTGAIVIAKKDSSMIQTVQQGYDKYNIKYQKLSSTEIKEKYEEFKLFPNEYFGLLENDAGILFPEKCIQTMINLGLQLSPKSKIMTNTEVISISENEDGLVKVDLNNNQVCYSKKIIISPGMWATDFLAKYSPQYKDALRIQENTLFWFESEQQKQFQQETFPIFFVEQEEQKKQIYGFPKVSQDGLTKFALHNSGRTFSSYTEMIANQKTEQPKLAEQNEEIIKRCVENTFDQMTIKSLKNKCNCFYTSTSDENFIIDYLNNNPKMVFLSPCSGHGFKFAIYIGKLAVDMTNEFKTKHEEFLFKRFDK